MCARWGFQQPSPRLQRSLRVLQGLLHPPADSPGPPAPPHLQKALNPYNSGKGAIPTLLQPSRDHKCSRPPADTLISQWSSELGPAVGGLLGAIPALPPAHLPTVFRSRVVSWTSSQARVPPAWVRPEALAQVFNCTCPPSPLWPWHPGTQNRQTDRQTEACFGYSALHWGSQGSPSLRARAPTEGRYHPALRSQLEEKDVSQRGKSWLRSEGCRDWPTLPRPDLGSDGAREEGAGGRADVDQSLPLVCQPGPALHCPCTEQMRPLG